MTLIVLEDSSADSTNVSENPVLSFYWERAGKTFESRDPVERGTAYVMTILSVYKYINNKGKVDNEDSLSQKRYYSWGKLDSVKTLKGDESRFKNLILTVPDFFADHYQLEFYPNDTGAGDMSIGFDTGETSDSTPTGLLVFDRQSYLPHWLYLYYPDKKYFERFSRSYRFTVLDGLIFPDSVWEVGAKQGVFFKEHYRIETRILEININKQ